MCSIAVQCDDVTYVTGNVTFSTDGLESMAVFTCGPGLSLKGSSSLSCNTSGSWMGEMPECGKFKRKPVLRVFDQVRHKSTSTGTETCLTVLKFWIEEISPSTKQISPKGV